MSKIAFFGGSGGLGVKLAKDLESRGHEVNILSSRSVDITKDSAISNYFFLNQDLEIVIVFSNYNYDKMLHSYKKLDKFEEIDKQIAVNITGLSKVVSTALYYMRKQGGGTIILASSVLVKKPTLGTAVYTACKAYAESLVRTVAHENGDYGITANCIRMGYMDGGLTDTLHQDILSSVLSNIPAGDLGPIEDIGNTVDFLIKTPYINGSVIELTGGL